MQSKPIKQKRCVSCKELFTPKRIGLKLTKSCSPECEGKIEKKAKPKKPKVKTATYLKVNVLWPIFSLYIKLTHSKDGKYCNCYTCGSLLEIGTANCQGGHCLPKSVYKNLYFDERAVRPQCYFCNINCGGMHYDFCVKLKDEIGCEEFDEMMLHGRDVVKRDRQWYLENIEYYKDQNEMLKNAKCKEM